MSYNRSYEERLMDHAIRREVDALRRDMERRGLTVAIIAFVMGVIAGLVFKAL